MNMDIHNRLFAEEIAGWLPFTGRRILEIGCGNGDMLKYIAKYYSPNHIVGIDPGLDDWWNIGESSGDNWEVRSGDAESLEFEDNEFDAVITVSTFEHIGNTAKVLSEIRRVLKPYGRFYTSFRPVWTSIVGHHFVAPEDDWWNEEHLALIPPWGHLYMSEPEMKRHLESENVQEPLKSQILDFIYHSALINRKPQHEITADIHNSGMIVRHYSEQVRFSRFDSGTQNELTAGTAGRLLDMGYDISEIGVWGMKVCLEKLAANQGGGQC